MYKSWKFITFRHNHIESTICGVASSINKYISNCSRSNHKELSWCTSSWLQANDARVVSGSWLSPCDYSSTNVKANGGANISTARDDWWDIINCKDNNNKKKIF